MFSLRDQGLNASPIVGVTISNDGAQSGGGFTNLGYSFVANVATNVVSLGIWDQDGDGLLNRHEVGLWAANGTLLASAFVGAGAAGILDSGFRFTDIAPVPLTAGQTYYVAATFNGPGDGDVFVDNVTSVLAAPQITYDSPRLGFGSALSFPALVGSGTNGYWGGNVRLDATQAVPEPTTMVLLGSGLATAFLRRRRR